MNIKLGLLLFMGLAAVSSMPISTPSKRPSLMQVLDLVEMGHISFMFDLNRLEEEIKNPEALTKEDLNSMGVYVDKQTASIGKQLDMTRWLKLRTRLESTEWMRVDEMVNFLGSMHAQFNKLRTDIHHWIILKDYHHSNDTMKPFPDLLPYTTTTLAPLSTQTPFHSLINIDMDRYGKNETVVLWKKLAVELRNNHNDLAKVEELADRSLVETGKVMDRVESIWARLRVMDNKTEEYNVAKNDVEFLTTMARRLYTRHEDAVLRANKLRELIASGKIPQAPIPPTTTTTPMPTTTKAPGGFVEIPSEKKEDDGDWIAVVGDAMILSAQDTEKYPF